MAEDGIAFRYVAPRDPGVWQAPETLAMCAALVAAPMLVTAFLSLRNRGKVNAWNAFVMPPYRAPLIHIVVLWLESSVLLLCLASWSGDYVTINTAAGLPAASALIAMVATALFESAVFCLMLGRKYEKALPNAKLERAFIFAAGGTGCLVTGAWVGGLVGSVAVALWWGAIGLPMLAAGLLMWRSIRDPLGHAAAESVQEAELRARQAEARQAEARAPKTGAYLGVSAARYWRSILEAAVTPALLMTIALLMVGLADKLGEIVRSAEFGLFALALLGLGSLIGFAAWVGTRHDARLVTWDELGLEIAWYTGEPRRYKWSELTSVKFHEYQTPGSARVVTRDGRVWSIVQSRPEYNALSDALKAHLWAASDPLAMPVTGEQRRV